MMWSSVRLRSWPIETKQQSRVEGCRMIHAVGIANQRVGQAAQCDQPVLRLIRNRLSVGVIEDRVWAATDVWTPQGATVSPLLAELYLHYVFDLWVQQWRRTHAQGDMIITRGADDFIVGCEHRQGCRAAIERPSNADEREDSFGQEFGSADVYREIRVEPRLEERERN